MFVGCKNRVLSVDGAPVIAGATARTRGAVMQRHATGGRRRGVGYLGSLVGVAGLNGCADGGGEREQGTAGREVVAKLVCTRWAELSVLGPLIG